MSAGTFRMHASHAGGNLGRKYFVPQNSGSFLRYRLRNDALWMAVKACLDNCISGFEHPRGAGSDIAATQKQRGGWHPRTPAT
jgi:hypothetical protein